MVVMGMIKINKFIEVSTLRTLKISKTFAVIFNRELMKRKSNNSKCSCCIFLHNLGPSGLSHEIDITQREDIRREM